MRILISIFILVNLSFLNAQPEFSEMAVRPGAFSRIGFGARGIGMGNAMSAVTEGNLVSYYNPAITVFQKNNSFQTSYTFLSFDRALNFLNFTRKFDFYSSRDTSTLNRKPSTTAGVSIGIINSGVGKIDGRDNNGLKTEELSTSENQFFLSVANRFSERLSVGISTKLYYYKLYEEITSTGIGLDVGVLYRINDEWNVALMISDLNSKYEWDSAPVYDRDGIITKDDFPLLKKIGFCYTRKDIGFIAGFEFENSNANTNIIRFGAEYNIYDALFLRAGLDQFNLSNKDWAAKPSAGFSYFKQIDGIIVGVNYAFQLEQYSSSDRHIVGVNINF
ncbi:MAG: hypothetical protein MUO34_05810 [Ignavibacteriaceae bacterium]|nr:hypothetical protein [Ignavibacteriaceae bacterium]